MRSCKQAASSTIISRAVFATRSSQAARRSLRQHGRPLLDVADLHRRRAERLVLALEPRRGDEIAQLRGGGREPVGGKARSGIGRRIKGAECAELIAAIDLR